MTSTGKCHKDKLMEPKGGVPVGGSIGPLQN